MGCFCKNESNFEEILINGCCVVLQLSTTFCNLQRWMAGLTSPTAAAQNPSNNKNKQLALNQEKKNPYNFFEGKGELLGMKKSFERTSYGSIERTTGDGVSPATATSNEINDKCSQKESANNLIAVITGAGNTAYAVVLFVVSSSTGQLTLAMFLRNVVFTLHRSCNGLVSAYIDGCSSYYISPLVCVACKFYQHCGSIASTSTRRKT